MKLLMSRDMSDLLNRTGMILGFLAFWFVAPEFLGEARLRSWEKSLAKLIEILVIVVFVSIVPLLLVISAFQRFSVLRALEDGQLSIDKLGSLWQFIRPDLLGIGGWGIGLVAVWLGGRLVSKMANDSRVRRTSLFLGAILFTLSFALQFIATFQR
jgi:hypothetical protein